MQWFLEFFVTISAIIQKHLYALEKYYKTEFKFLITSTPTTGSPTITLFQLHSNYHTGLNPQKTKVLKIVNFNLKFQIFFVFFFKLCSGKLLDFQTIQFFERDGRCVQSLIYHSP
jgi:hypothetical protein